MLTLDRNSGTPLVRQLYLQYRKKILSGSLGPGTRLPSSRALASQLGVSRNVVLESYDLLLAEGYLISRRGSGTFVAEGAVMDTAIPSPLHIPPLQDVSMGYDPMPGVINFRAGTPDLASFPQKTWQKMVREVFSTPMEEILAYGHPEGRMELREAIANYLRHHRELVCHPDQVVITAGTTQAISIACILLLGSRRRVILEDPITNDLQTIIRRNGAEIVPLPVDDQGLCTSLLPPDMDPACIYVTPSHQFPMGSTLTIQRRIELVTYAKRKNSFIIEDDYDSEFRFDGPALSSLHSLCPERVIYVGTFSKTLCPAIRIGYMVLPPELISLARTHKWQSDLHNEVVSQLCLARFMEGDHYLKHLSRMRVRYRRRRECLEKALMESFGHGVKILGSSTGLHLTAEFADNTFGEADLLALVGRGARFYSIGSHAILSGPHASRLLIGYGNLSREEIREGVKILAAWLQEK